jgi:hypothetical protein
MIPSGTTDRTINVPLNVGYEFFTHPPVLLHQAQRVAVYPDGLTSLEILVIGLANVLHQVSFIDVCICTANIDHFSIHLLVVLQVDIEKRQGYFHFRTW